MSTTSRPASLHVQPRILHNPIVNSNAHVTCAKSLFNLPEVIVTIALTPATEAAARLMEIVLHRSPERLEALAWVHKEMAASRKAGKEQVEDDIFVE